MMKPSNSGLPKKSFSLPKLLPRILNNYSNPPRLHFPTRDDPNLAENVGKRHYTITNSTSLQKILNPEVTNRINSYRSQNMKTDKGKLKIQLDVKGERKSEKNIRFASEGTTHDHQYHSNGSKGVPPNPAYINELIQKKAGLKVEQKRTESERKRSKIGIEFRGQKKQKYGEKKKEKRIGTQIVERAQQEVYPPASQVGVQKIKFANPTYLSGVFL